MKELEPSPLLLSSIDAACNAAMHLKKSKKEPFTCLVLQAEHNKGNYEILPVYAPKYEASIELARQHLVENREKLLLHVMVYDATVTIEGTSSDAIVIEATEVGQEGTFKLLRRYAPPGLFSKASAEEKLTFVAYEPFKKSR